MFRKTSMLAAALLAGGLMATDAQARVGGVGHGGGLHGFRDGFSQRSATFDSPSLAQPPPQQQPAPSFVGPAPSIGTPMERVPPVAPLATPPTR